jgi:hypothetical protein
MMNAGSMAMCDIDHTYPLTGGRFCGKILRMLTKPLRLVVQMLLVAVALLAGLETLPAWAIFPALACVAVVGMLGARWERHASR